MPNKEERNLERQIDKDLEIMFNKISPQEIRQIAEEARILRSEIQKRIDRYCFIYPYYRRVSISNYIF